jgi:hypothetical protein
MVIIPPPIFHHPKVSHDTPGRYCKITKKPEISDLKAGMDFRQPQYRREVFLRFYEFHTKYRAHPGVVYLLIPALSKRLGWGLEDRLWFSFLNGNTQNPITSWLIWKRFPSFKRLNLGALERWYAKERGRLEFDTDRRYFTGELVNAVAVYKKLCKGSQEAFFAGVLTAKTETENFDALWPRVRREFHTFGRLSAFSYLEYLRIAGLPLDCSNLFLEDRDGSRSHRNGLCKVLGRDDLDWHRSNPTGFTGRYAPGVTAWLKEEAEELLREAGKRFEASYFTLESALCTYKSWYRENRRYPGVYLDMLHDRIRRTEERWPEEYFSLFWNIRKTLPARLLQEATGDGMSKRKQNWFRNTGQVILMARDWPCFKGDYENNR